MATDNVSAEIGLRIEGKIAVVVISNERRRNAFTFRMLQDIPRIFKELDDMPGVRSIVIEGAGESAFASGDDISEFAEYRSTAADESKYMATALAAFNAPAACSKPVIAAITGFCLGGAMQLAAACDLRICGQSSRFAVPASKLGVGYPMDGISRFVNLVGMSNASKIFLSGRIFSCDELKSSGFVTEVAPDAEVKSVAYAYAAEIAEHAPLTLRALKASIAACASSNDAEKRKALEMIAQCPSSADFIEGRNAFLQKRKAVFIGS